MLLLFDVDGTLTVPRSPIQESMKELLYLLRSKGHTLACVSGSDLPKIREQLLDAIDYFDFVFTQNGLASYRKEANHLILFHNQSIHAYLGEEKYQQLVNAILRVLSLHTLPIKRSHFIELRSGLINVCPIGRQCTQQEREAFEGYDQEHNIRKQIVSQLQEQLCDIGVQYSIGGQISIDVFPIGWDKTYCLPFLPDVPIYFFGDRIFPGGNNYEIACHPRVNAMKVKNCSETAFVLQRLLDNIQAVIPSNKNN